MAFAAVVGPEVRRAVRLLDGGAAILIGLWRLLPSMWRGAWQST